MDVLLLPGVVLPASLAYAALLEALPPDVRATAKELELYADGDPAADYDVDAEVEGILRAAAGAGFDQFHLGGYSAGGATALRFATLHPGRLRSLTLLEPAWIGNEGRSPGELAVQRALDALGELPPPERMARFVRLQLADGVEPPPPPAGPPPPWMASRPQGIATVLRAFAACRLDLGELASAGVPVYFALGGRSNPDLYAAMAERLAAALPDVTLDVFAERHHFDPPHRAEPDRLAAALVAFWRAAEAS